jgi:hypothetical protein
MAIDISWLGEGMPIFGFVLVFVLAYAILKKTKILGDSNWINITLSFILTVIFASVSSVRDYVTNITPWFVVILVMAFFFSMLVLFMIKDPSSFVKPITIVLIILFSLTLIAMFFYSFQNAQAYLPGADEEGANAFLLSVKHFILEERFLSGLLLFVIAIIVGFIITR